MNDTTNATCNFSMKNLCLGGLSETVLKDELWSYQQRLLTKVTFWGSLSQQFLVGKFLVKKLPVHRAPGPRGRRPRRAARMPRPGALAALD